MALNQLDEVYHTVQYIMQNHYRKTLQLVAPITSSFNRWIACDTTVSYVSFYFPVFLAYVFMATVMYERNIAWGNLQF